MYDWLQKYSVFFSFILNVEPRVAKKWNVANRAKPVPRKGQIKNWIFAHWSRKIFIPERRVLLRRLIVKVEWKNVMNWRSNENSKRNDFLANTRTNESNEFQNSLSFAIVFLCSIFLTLHRLCQWFNCCIRKSHLSQFIIQKSNNLSLHNKQTTVKKEPTLHFYVLKNWLACMRS